MFLGGRLHQLQIDRILRVEGEVLLYKLILLGKEGKN